MGRARLADPYDRTSAPPCWRVSLSQRGSISSSRLRQPSSVADKRRWGDDGEEGEGGPLMEKEEGGCRISAKE